MESNRKKGSELEVKIEALNKALLLLEKVRERDRGQLRKELRLNDTTKISVPLYKVDTPEKEALYLEDAFRRYNIKNTKYITKNESNNIIPTSH
ncbi:MAG: hypothetical protein ACRCZM_11825 [Bacteroidales bacterium]